MCGGLLHGRLLCQLHLHDRFSPRSSTFPADGLSAHLRGKTGPFQFKGVGLDTLVWRADDALPILFHAWFDDHDEPDYIVEIKKVASGWNVTWECLSIGDFRFDSRDRPLIFDTQLRGTITWKPPYPGLASMLECALAEKAAMERATNRVPCSIPADVGDVVCAAQDPKAAFAETLRLAGHASRVTSGTKAQIASWLSEDFLKSAAALHELRVGLLQL